MAFQPRTFQQILDDAIAFVAANTTVTDFEEGSVIRTILEAAALEDDEQYFQMVQLLDAFSIYSAVGEDLDARVADANLIRLQTASSSGNIFITDGNLITDSLAFDVSASDITIILNDSSILPTSGFPYTIRIGESTVAVEDVSVSANNTGTNTLTVSSLVNNHSIGARVSFVSGNADQTLNAGIQVQVPAKGGAPAKVFTSVEEGIIVNGNFRSTPIRVRSNLKGKIQNIGSNQIAEFTSSPPFSGAGVTNDNVFVGGRDVESNKQLRDRYLGRLQSLTAGTPLALREGVLGLTDPVTGQRTVTSNLVEDFVNDEVTVYIDDGTGFTPDQVQLARDSLNGGVSSGVSLLPLNDVSEFPDEGYLILSPENASQIELIEYTSVNYITNIITLGATTANAHDDGDEVVLVDAINLSADGGANFFITGQFPIVRNSHRLWISTGGAFELQTLDTDYILNRGRGQIELLDTSGLPSGSQVVMNYSYYTGIVFQAQRTLNGDSADFANVPGISSAGVIVTVESPLVRRVTVRVSIVASAGFKEIDLAPLVQEAIEVYIASLGIGEDVIVAEIIERAMGVPGVFNVFVALPTSDVAISNNEIALPVSSTGVSLVTVA